MGGMLCTGARRLAILVASALALVAVPFVVDAHMRTLPAACGAMALGLLLGALTPLRQAQRLVRETEAPPPVPPAGMVYRANPRATDMEATENQATRQAVMALLLLSLAGTLTVVAAAAR
jgi:hypothetical protein